MCLEIAQPIAEKDVNEATPADFVMTKIDMGPSTHEADIENFNVVAAKLVERTEKEKQSKDQLKQQVQTLSSYLKSIADTSTMPLNVAHQTIILSLEGEVERDVIEGLQKYQVYGKVTENWVAKVKSLAFDFIVKAKAVHDEALIKKETIEKDLKNFKKEEVAWKEIMNDFRQMMENRMDILVAENILPNTEENYLEIWT